MICDVLLNKLEGVRQTGRGRWIARCPGHDDRTPSLLVSEGTSKEGEDTVRLHCFAGCDKQNILGAVGLTFSDLYPPKPTRIDHRMRKQRRPFNAHDILEASANELLIGVMVM